MKTIIFGGSFDPIHNGHIILAKTALKAINADKVVFLIAKNPRWKSKRTDDTHRFNMLSLAIKDYPNFEISRLELDSNEEVNYTFDTISRYKKEENEQNKEKSSKIIPNLYLLFIFVFIFFFKNKYKISNTAKGSKHKI